ncbi:MAG: DUF362 domain-containing protein [Dictyoglomus thermophilum]|nr:DUF362 domain-containing protein [Dictyoglomus thermophilum]MCX7719731.1 DUF362 domain-containing protein [Dictyoglomus thermophilum]
MSKVAITRTNKDPYKSVGDAIDLIGGIDKYVKKGDIVLIKPNAFISKEEKGFISDPQIVLSLAKLCKEQGAKEVYIGERTPTVFKWYKNEDINFAKVVCFDDPPYNLRTLPEAEVIKSAVPIPKIVEECDVFINVPGLRFHALTIISNGMKNMMGIMPKETTLLIHVSGLEDAIVDLNRFRKSNLVVTTAIHTLVGNFPVSGYGIESNTLIVGDNVVAVDAIAAKILKVDPYEIRHLTLANKLGLGPIDLSEIELSGVPIESLEWREKIVKPVLDYEEFRDKINIIDPSKNCLGCKRAMASGIAGIFEENPKADLKDITVVIGPVEELNKHKLTDKIILFGNCTFPYKDKGLYVQGCPPRANMAKQAIKKIMENK